MRCKDLLFGVSGWPGHALTWVLVVSWSAEGVARLPCGGMVSGHEIGCSQSVR